MNQFIIVILCFIQLAPFLLQGGEVAAPDHALWDRVLKANVTAQARVDYQAIKAHPRDLEQYLAQVAAPWPSQTAIQRKAALINAYNALTIQWIVSRYPVKSIWKTPHPFKGKRHTVDGHMTSLDDIETELRNMGDPRIHGAVICASIGCPPLRREAFLPETLDVQLDDQVRSWLASPDRNRFDAQSNTATVSEIFKWYRGDFEKNGQRLNAFLARYAPSGKADFLLKPSAKLTYVPYAWGLNDVTAIGESYSNAAFLFDHLKNN